MPSQEVVEPRAIRRPRLADLRHLNHQPPLGRLKAPRDIAVPLPATRYSLVALPTHEVGLLLLERLLDHPRRPQADQLAQRGRARFNGAGILQEGGDLLAQLSARY